MIMKIINNFLLLSILCACTNSGYFGEQYLGAKYVNNPLGEEKTPDMDPLIRFDAFDCVTFVETVLADADIDKLNKIRYKDGQIDFINRNHFIELDWLNNNSDMFENVSEKYGKTTTRTIVIDKQNWFKKNHNIDTDFEKQTVNLQYLPYSNLPEIKNEKTLIVLFISGNPKIYDKIGSDLAVVHMGFLLPDGTLRHASRYYGRVMDVSFKDYVNARKQNKNNLGIALVEIK